MRDTPLNQEFARLGLARYGTVGQALGVDHDTVQRFTKSGLIPTRFFEWGNKRWRGVPLADLERLKERLAAVK